MREAVLLWRGRHLYLIREPTEPVVDLLLPGPPEEIAAQLLGVGEPRIDPRALSRTGLDPGSRVGVEAPALRRVVQRGGWIPVEAPLAELREALGRLPPPDREEERAIGIAAARMALATAMEDPVEVLLSLAREEERLERALGRERNAGSEFEDLPGAAFEEYAERQSQFYAAFARHHAEIEGRLQAEAVALAPTLSSVVGPKVAARLIASAGGLGALARMPASRIQLLGARRRPSHGRGPRYGLLFRASRMDEIPLGRQGAYARSLAALAAISARLDVAVPHRDRSASLLVRRDRRATSLSAEVR
ncbi:MAG: hypothetical protein ACREBT_01485 [Thermoplasmata archaeon]